MSRLVLRDYQKAAHCAVIDALDWGYDSMVLTAATGTGKTVTFAHLVRYFVREEGKRVLILAPRRELIKQAYLKIRNMCDLSEAEGGVGVPEIDKEMGSLRFDPRAKVVVGCINTCYRENRLLDWEPDVIIADEAHYVRADAGMWKALFERFPNAVKVGLTATGYRGDRLPVFHERMDGTKTTVSERGKERDTLPNECSFFRHVYDYPYEQAVEDGWLVSAKVHTLQSKLDISGVKSSGGDGASDSDFNQKELSAALMPNEQVIVDRINLAITRWKEVASDRPTIVFCPSVEYSHWAAQLWQQAGYTAKAIDYQTPDVERDVHLDDVKAGNVQVTCNYGIYCLDEQTEMLTRSGWKTIDTIKETDRIANWDNGRIYFRRPKEILKRQRHEWERMITLSNRRMDIRVTQDHNMVYRWRGGQWLKKRATELEGARVSVPVSGYAAPEIHSSMSLDECRLIGFWIGDGSVHEKSSGSITYTLAQSCDSPKIIDWVNRLLTRCEIDFRTRVIYHKNPLRNGANYAPSHEWSIPKGTGIGLQQRNGIHYLSSYLKKDGTDLLWRLSEDQFDAFIEGYWMADGDHEDGTPKTCKRIAMKSKQMADLLQSIAVCRGYRANISVLDANQKRDSRSSLLYRLSLRKSGAYNFSDNSLESETAEWKPERVWCATSHSGNIVVRRNGKVYITGNTHGTDVPEWSCEVILRPTESPGLTAQMLGRVTRPAEAIAHTLGTLNTPEERKALIAASEKPYSIVIEIVDIVGKHRLATVSTVAGLPPQFDLQGRSLQEATELVREFEKIKSLVSFECPGTFEELRAAWKQADILRNTHERHRGNWLVRKDGSYTHGKLPPGFAAILTPEGDRWNLRVVNTITGEIISATNDIRGDGTTDYFFEYAEHSAYLNVTRYQEAHPKARQSKGTLDWIRGWKWGGAGPIKKLKAAGFTEGQIDCLERSQVWPILDSLSGK